MIERKVFSDLEQKVLQQIENGTEELNDIHLESGISMNQLLGVILELELKGIVQQNIIQAFTQSKKKSYYNKIKYSFNQNHL